MSADSSPAVTSPPNGPPSDDIPPPSVMTPPERRAGEPRSLTFYLIYALAFHALVYGVAGFIKHTPTASTLDVTSVVEIIDPPPVEEETSLVPQPEVEESAPPPPAPAVRPRLAEPTKVPNVPAREPSPEPPQTVAEELTALDSDSKAPSDFVVPEVKQVVQVGPVEPPPPGLNQMIGSITRGRSGPTGSAVGAGPGSGTGLGGVGSKWGDPKSKGLPVVSGVGVFGQGQKGALKGSLCFIPPDTRSLLALKRCEAQGIMYANVLNIPQQPFEAGFPGVSERYTWFSIDYNGKFNVSKPGTYTFRLASDDGSLMWINGKLLINNDGLHAYKSKTGAVDLEEGSHRIRVLYYQGPPREIALQLYVTPPGETERLWGPDL
jgi:hypothetical protein